MRVCYSCVRTDSNQDRSERTSALAAEFAGQSTAAGHAHPLPLMKQSQDISLPKRILMVLAGTVLALWMAAHATPLFGTQNGIIRSVLSILFAAVILLRPKQKTEASGDASLTGLVTAALLGVGCIIVGLIIPVRHLEWIGIILLLFACLRWALPTPFRRDILLALLVLYWVAPLPTPWFGRLQIWMQIASVEGSEWLLHILNVRAWAEGLILRTGLHVFEVPAWCSGMRTATTVFILSLALGILRRLKWYEIAAFIFWSLFHALLLNVLRICAMVAFARQTHSRLGLDFLHDTAGLIVILGVVIVYFEMLYLERRNLRMKQVRKELNVEQVDALSEYPPFWHTLNQNRGKALLIALLIAGSGVLAYRSRPYHRAMMLKDVAITLRDQGEIKEAQKLARIVSDMLPEDIDWHFVAVRLHLISGQHDRVLTELESSTDLSAAYLTQKRVLMAYALMSLGRIDEAAEIVDLLPEDIRTKDPRVAMILAEMALRGGNVSSVAVHVITASGWAPNMGRIRNLYPYLRIHRKWKAMASSDFNIPYADPVQALSILEAYMNLNRVPKVADITLQAVGRWPRDMRVLEPLYFMTIKRGGGEWEERFSAHLIRAIAACDTPDLLYETLHKCFTIYRPDLAWAIYDRIQSIDANHPTLPMSVAKYGHRWFSFTKRRLGIPAAQATETLDLKPFFLLAQQFPEWKRIAANTPYGKPLAKLDPTPTRKAALREAIARFAVRASEGSLSLDMQYLYALALEMNSRVDLAKQQLEHIVQQHPEEAEDARVVLSEIYERKGDWINVYETLRTYLDPRTPDPESPSLDDIELEWPPDNLPRRSSDMIHLKPLLRLVRSQLELRLGLAALHTAKVAVELYPYSTRAIELLSTALSRVGDTEAALNLLSKPRVRDLRRLDILEAQALFETERFNELSTFCRQSLLPQVQLPPGTTQSTSLPSAELAVLWHHVSIPSEAQFAENAETLRRNLRTASTGLRRLLELWLAAYEQHCAGDLAQPKRWLECGRDALEKAVALNQLTLLLCREERYTEAERIARRAIIAHPELPILWHILISLSGGDAETVSQARLTCPDDADIWLAELVVKTQPKVQSGQDETAQQALRSWVHSSVTEALEADLPPATLTRAGEYLWRGNMKEEAARIARSITERARGLLPSYILAIRCALHERDEDWALLSTEKAIEAALQPLPEFYENLVALKAADGVIDTDPDMVNALRKLRKSDPDNPVWPQMLGYIRFHRGGWEIIDALFEMNVAIAGGATNRTPYLIASEVSRLLRNYDRAADILNHGLQHSPGHPALLNNLAFTLSQNTKRLSEAVALIPDLLRMSKTDPQIKDTLAAVYIATGRLDEAQKTVTSILRETEPGSPLRFRGNMLLSEIAWKQGRPREARGLLERLLKSSKNIPDEDILAANALLAQVMGESAEYVNPMRLFVNEELNGISKPEE
jgi:exosortase/archaeosortase family protein